MSGNKQWVRITPVQNIPLREGRSVSVGSREIAIFNLGNRFLAVDGRCPHKGGPLAEGIVTGATVVCPLHAWKINLETGCAAKADVNPACVATYQTRVESGIVLIELPEPSGAEQGNSFLCGEQNWPASSDSPSTSPA